MKKKIIFSIAAVFLTAGLALADSNAPVRQNSQNGSAQNVNSSTQNSNSTGQTLNMPIDDAVQSVMSQTSHDSNSDLKNQMDQMKEKNRQKAAKRRFQEKLNGSQGDAKTKLNRTETVDHNETISVQHGSKGKGKPSFSKLNPGNHSSLKPVPGNGARKVMLNPQPLPPGMKNPGPGGMGSKGLGESSSK